MSSRESIPAEIKVSPEAQHQYDHLSDNIDQLKYLLALSGGWVNRKNDHGLTPFRQTITYKWNVPFYRGFYPELPENDVLGYRVSAKLDGNAIVHLSDMSKQLESDNPARYLEFDLNNLQPLVDGTPINNIVLGIDNDTVRKSTAATKRFEQGMPRGMRIFSAMIPLDHLSRSEAREGIDITAHQDKLFDILDLSDQERSLTLSLLQEIHDRRKLN